MKYKELEDVDLMSLTKPTLAKWVETLYKKAKRISHSEQTHKHDSVFWKRQLAGRISTLRMDNLCKLADESRLKLKP